MQGIILAAGMGKRLKFLTNDNTKCMVKVNGITMIERSLRILDKKNLSRIVIVVGYKGKELIDYINTLGINTPIEFIDNPVYNKTNNIYSLALAKDYLCSEDTLLLESDLVFEESVIDALLDDDRQTLALVDKFESWMDGTCMELDDEDCITNFIPGKYLRFSKKDNYYKTVNIYKFSASFSKNTYVPFLTAYEKAMGENEYYESVIKLISLLETREIRAKRLEGQVWYEIDNIQDLDIAESLFASSEEDHFDKIASRYGGYWRYPKMIDFCYLVNPYYPPVKMIDEMKSNFTELLTQYPSGMAVNSLAAASSFGIRQNHIVVGNGAAELIKSLMEKLLSDTDKIGCVYPTFEEYPNRYDRDRILSYVPQTEDYHYTEDDLIEFYSDKEINALVLINPDNPSGNYISRDGVLKLIEWAKNKGIVLIIDESFVDFADLSGEETVTDLTILKEDILALYNRLYIVKSISKCYGVPGARLGIMASSDEDTICFVKKDVAIWNINSFGEFFMQIKEKYDKDYFKSLEKVRNSRKNLMNALSEIKYITPFSSQANYILCRIEGGKSSREIAMKLLENNLFIKDITPKINDGKQYVRIAVRNEEDNGKLIDLLKSFE
ncbi:MULTISPECIES: aminotransferase class I/II-fold pyridoxal phosphate-dependent enzyme [unclassified Butyrivibrio]|uniref:aminotransferase class I/II-fold pyridoxal phosphate-dependent enzyme n=1 Tax=unclassified Butyrivibrio TaxID=2639466 RepID=UPI0004060A0E|nr:MULTISPECIES: aminotransferase class I/II-fold pyridoxal phosphate-dependent enzyme [unclassified Butyrivibrio]